MQAKKDIEHLRRKRDYKAHDHDHRSKDKPVYDSKVLGSDPAAFLGKEFEWNRNGKRSTKQGRGDPSLAGAPHWQEKVFIPILTILQP